MTARPLSILVIAACIFSIPFADATGQQLGSVRSNIIRANQEIDIENVIGHCGCENCNGRLEHNDPYEESKDGDGPNNFFIVTRWTATAMSGGGLNQGDPTRLTWSIIPDGTDANGGAGFVPSNLIVRLDTIFNESNAGTPDLTNRFWHGLMEQSFERWAELAGLEYFYEPNDDGAVNFGAGGSVGVRGDVRIGGFNIDGPNGILAFNDFPNIGDMAMDSSETGNFGNPGANFRIFRNIVMHEHGHGLGFAHVESNNAGFLMEPFIQGTFDGPQLDDIRAVQRSYGDVFEKSNNFAGNNTIANATDLGTMNIGANLTIGIDGATGTVVGTNDDDFVSVDDNGDVDFFRVGLTEPVFLNVTLTPVGAPYNQSQQGGGGGIPENPSISSNLTLAILNSSGSIIQQVNDTGNGEAEMILDLPVIDPQIFVRVTGNANNVQLYTLNVDVNEFDIPDMTPPSSVAVNPGMLISGGTGDLANSDDQRLVVRPSVPASPSDSPIGIFLTFSVPNNQPTALSVSVESSSNTPNVLQIISMFNNTTGAFEVVDFREPPAVEENTTITPAGNPQRFVTFVGGNVLMDVRYGPNGPVTQYPWTIRLDQLTVNTIQ